MEKHFFRRSMVVLLTTCMIGTALSACGREKTPDNEYTFTINTTDDETTIGNEESSKATDDISDVALVCKEKACNEDLSENEIVFTVLLKRNGILETVSDYNVTSINKEKETDDSFTYTATFRIGGKEMTTPELVIPKMVPIYAGYNSNDNTLYLAATEQEITDTGADCNYGDVSTYLYALWRNKAEKVKTINILSEIKPTNCFGWFLNFENLTQIKNIENFNTKNVYDMGVMFGSCCSLTSLDLSHFDTGSVTSMSDMFRDCTSLASLDLSNFNTSKVESMDGMFKNCSALVSLNISGFDTSNVGYMNSMFCGCNALSSIDVTHFDTSKTLSMESMFCDCSSLKTLDVSNFTTGLVSCMESMFASCKLLQELDISNFDTSKVENMDTLFPYCENLKVLNLGEFNTSSLDVLPSFSGCNQNLKIYTTSEETKKKLLEIDTDKRPADEDIIVGSAKREWEATP